MIMCHLLGDTLAELHAAAAMIGMHRKWFQPLSFPHYDLSIGRRTVAIERGAVEIDRRTCAQIMRRLKADPAFMEAWKAEMPMLGGKITAAWVDESDQIRP